MITFRTQFPLCQECDGRKLLEVGKVWMKGSPHSSLKSSIDKVELPINGEKLISSQNESIEFSRYIDDDIDISGIKYINSMEPSLKWSTEIVGTKNRGVFWVSIILDVATELPVGQIPFGKKPHIIKTIVETMCIFQPKPASDSTRSRPPIPFHSGHSFHLKSATDSRGIRPPLPTL